MTKEGKILKALSGFYYVDCSGEVITCRARGNFRNENITPLVGDDVKIQLSDNNTGYVVEILERKNELLRPKVANIDYSIIVVSVKDPEFSSKLLNKTICLNENSNVDIIIVFTKLDLLNDEELNKMKEIMNYYYEIGYRVFTNSDEDIEKLKQVISEKYVAISGQSGAGKSTFINKLAEHLDIETGEISKHLGRGRHTTRHTEFYQIDDFYIADTPGFSSLDITFIEKEDLQYLFREFNDYDCKFKPCNHMEEVQCGVKEAVESKEILERKNELLRPKVANIDYSIIVVSVKDPEFSSKLLNKTICLNENSNVDIIIVFTKLDLLSDEELNKMKEIMNYYYEIGYQVFTNSDEDIEKLKQVISEKYVAISGQSGAGKSTFINKLAEDLDIETGEISKHLGRGRHTTRHTEFYQIDDFYIADTPGFSSLDITFIEKEDLQYLFREFNDYDCKFKPCNHMEEVQCGVKEAVESKEILESRYEDYKVLFTEKQNQKRKYIKER